MRVLGIDLGSKRIGLARSDSGGDFAFPAGVLARKSPKHDLAELERWIAEHEIDRVVVGLPLHLDGRAGPEAQAARRFAEELASKTGLPVETLDERWTTREAERVLRETRHRSHQRKQQVDAVAAAIILRTYLDRRRSADADAARGGIGGDEP